MNEGKPFLDRLLASASGDAPAAGARTRVVAKLASMGPTAAVAGASGATIAKSVGTAGVLGWTALATAVLGVGATAYALQSGRLEPQRDATVQSESAAAPRGDDESAALDPAPLAPAGSPSFAARAMPIERAHDVCQSVSLPDGTPSTCSTPGAPMLLEIVNTCTDGPVDLYWINYQCAEVFYRQLASGETYLQSTFATHPWRVRDHATHRLLKEIAVTSSAAAPVDAGSRELKKEVVVGPDDRAEEHDDSLCSEAGYVAQLTVTNHRSDAIEMYWLDYDCKEMFRGRVEPGDRWGQRTQDAHKWRVRDGRTHAILKEFAIDPHPGAQREYVSVP